ncbi:MAG: hypothetical protein PVF96_02050 [Candidatus Bathyarchaeota archaeon]|jgi:hypothetical protein
MRIELFDDEGNKYTISFQGNVTRQKALHLIELVELLGGTPNSEFGFRDNPSFTNFSKFEKVWRLVQEDFPVVWFSSKEVQFLYEQKLKEPVTLSTVSTYLSRMANRGLLHRIGESNKIKYKISPNIPSTTIRNKIS